MAYSAESHYGAKSGPGVLPRLGRSGRKLVRYRVTGPALKRKGWRSLLKSESQRRHSNDKPAWRLSRIAGVDLCSRSDHKKWRRYFISSAQERSKKISLLG